MIKFLDLQRINAQYAAELHAASARVIDSGWYLQGREVAAFESEYTRYIGTRHCITCGNGLDALTVMLQAYIQMGRLHEGDEVIVPANTFLATILSITANRLVPIFIEPRESDLQIDDTLIETHITPRTRAILLVHLYGICSYTERVGELCQKYGLLLLEDNAQAHGCSFLAQSSTLNPQPSTLNRQSLSSPLSSLSSPLSSLVSTPQPSLTGSLGSAAAHSFYPGKNLGALGDSGAVTTDDDELAATLRAICNYGFSKKYYADRVGRNSRMDELQAAFLRVKLQHLADDNRHRQQIARYYIEHITNPLIRVPRVESVFHIFTVFCKYRDRLQQYLLDHGVHTLIHYPVPPHLQDCYPEFHGLSLPLTERLAAEELSLPISPVLTLDEAAQVVDLVNGFTLE